MKVVSILTPALLLAIPGWAAVRPSPEPAGRGYVIETVEPLAPPQVGPLRQAGAAVSYVYVDFGGAAAIIAPSRVAEVRALPFVVAVYEDPVEHLDGTMATLPNQPYWHDLIDLENASSATGDGVWVAVLDSGFYPYWRSYFDDTSILTQYATAFNPPGPTGTRISGTSGATLTGWRGGDDRRVPPAQQGERRRVGRGGSGPRRRRQLLGSLCRSRCAGDPGQGL